MVASLLLLLSCIPATDQSAPGGESVQLTASRNNPYLGEWVEFTLIFRTTNLQTIRELRIPWLTPHEAWKVRWQWSFNTTESSPHCLLVRYQDVLAVAKQINPGEYQLRFKVLMEASPGDHDVREMTPVQWGSVSSQPLTLHLQRPTLQPLTGQSWNLGVGVYRIAAEWSKSNVVLGEETTLILKVSGTGSLAALTAPPFRSMPGWEGDRFLIDAGPVQWKNGERWFSFQVRPRQLRAMVPPLMVTSFDPNRGMAITQQINIPVWRVMAASDWAGALPGSSVNDALKHLPEFRRYSLAQHVPSAWESWAKWLLLLPVISIICIVIRQFLLWGAPQWMESLRWKRAALRSLKTLKNSKRTIPELRTILGVYFGLGLERAVSNDWDTLYNMSALSPQSVRLKALCEKFRFCEFSPNNQDHSVLLYEQMLQLFKQEKR